LPGDHAELVLDAALADLFTEGDRARDGVDGGAIEARPLPGAGDDQDTPPPDGIRSDEARPDPSPCPVGIPDGLLVVDPVLDELAADAAGLRRQTTIEGDGPSRLRPVGIPNPPVPGDPSTEPDRPAEAGGVLPRLAVTLFAAGFWSYRGRILDVTDRPAQRPHPRRSPRSSSASGS
jgi:hypothetical protein